MCNGFCLEDLIRNSGRTRSGNEGTEEAEDVGKGGDRTAEEARGGGHRVGHLGSRNCSGCAFSYFSLTATE